MFGKKKLTTWLVLAMMFLSLVPILGKAQERTAPDTTVPPALGVDVANMSRAHDGTIHAFSLKPGVQISAANFFTQYAADFHLGGNDKIRETSSRQDNLGYVQHRFEEYYRPAGSDKEYKVKGGQYILQEKNGVVVSGIGNIVNGLDSANLYFTASISKSTALTKALNALEGPGQFDWLVDAVKYKKPVATLLILPTDQELSPSGVKLAYEFVIHKLNPQNSYTVDVDAKTGAVLNKSDNAHYDNEQNVDVHDAEGYYSDGVDNAKTFKTVQYTDPSNQALKKRLELLPVSFLPGINWNPAIKTLCMSTDGTVFEHFIDLIGDNVFSGVLLSECQSPDGVSVHWGIQKALDYFRQFEWYGIDGNGQTPINAFVDYSENVTPAGRSRFLSEDKTYHFSGLQAVANNWDVHVGLNSVGHELTHGISDSLGQGNVVACSEANAVHESIANIMGLNVINQYRIDNGGIALWTYGEEATLDHTPYRNFANPKSLHFPDTYNGQYYAKIPSSCADNTFDPHVDGEIMDHWYYLLANGGNGTNDLGSYYTVNPIDYSKAQKLAFRILTTKLTVNSTFMDVREGSVQAAQELAFSDAEIESVKSAWYAVGVGGADYDLLVSPFSGQQSVEPWPATLMAEIRYPGLENSWEVVVSESQDFDDSSTQDLVVHVSDPDSTTLLDGKKMFKAKFNLKPNTLYYWKWMTVSVANEDDCTLGTDTPVCAILGYWVGIYHFTTDPKQVELVSPEEYSVNEETLYPWNKQINFSFKNVAGGPAEKYITIIDENWLDPNEVKLALPTIIAQSYNIANCVPPTPANPNPPCYIPGPHQYLSIVHDFDPNGSVQHTAPYNFFADTDYYWAEYAVGPADLHGEHSFSFISLQRHFKTQKPSTNLTSPVNDSQVYSPWKIGANGFLSWEKTAGSDGYKIEVSRTPDFSDLVDIGDDIAHGENTLNKAITLRVPESVNDDPPSGTEGLFYVRVIPLSHPKHQYELYFDNSQFAGQDVAPDGEPSKPRTINIDYTQTQVKNLIPADGKSVEYGKPVDFSWDGVSGAAEYYHQINIGDFIPEKTPYYENTFAGTVNPGVQDVSTSTDPDYYCTKVFALGPQGDYGMASEVHCYFVGPDKPVLGNGVNGQIFTYNNVDLKIASAYAPGGYNIRVRDENNNLMFPQATIARDPSGHTVFHVPVDLSKDPNLKSFTWVAEALGLHGEVVKSDSGMFKTQPVVDAPVLDTPNDGDNDVTYDPTAHFLWFSNYANNYFLNVGTAPGLHDVVNNQQQPFSAPHFLDVAGLSAHTTYYWSVRADANGFSATSAEHHFTTGSASNPPAGGGGGGGGSGTGNYLLSVHFVGPYTLTPEIKMPGANYVAVHDHYTGNVVTALYSGETNYIFNSTGSPVGQYDLRLTMANVGGSWGISVNDTYPLEVTWMGVTKTWNVGFNDWIDGTTFHYVFDVD